MLISILFLLQINSGLLLLLQHDIMFAREFSALYKWGEGGVCPRDGHINSTKCSRRNRYIRRKWFSRVHAWSIEKLGIKLGLWHSRPVTSGLILLFD